jgi:hypothetical protein
MVVARHIIEGHRTFDSIYEFEHSNTREDWLSHYSLARERAGQIPSLDGPEYAGEVIIEYIDVNERPKAYSKAAHAAEIKQRIESLREMLKEAEAEFKTLIS